MLKIALIILFILSVFASHKPLVSVIVRVYNRAHLLEETLDSIQEQTYNNIEIIIVDDASPDPEVMMILKQRAKKDRRIRLFTLEENVGGPEALNFGLTKVRGAFVAICDSDDVNQLNRLQLQVDFL